jgi:tetratricopeptide (TPR) repeat protein
MILAQTGERKGAIEQYSKALESAPNDPAIHYNLGAVLAEMGSDQEAITQFRAAVKSDSQLTKGHFQLANLLMRKGQYRDAVSEYSAVIAIDPHNRFARLMQAMALIRVKDYPEARARLEQGLSAIPDDNDLAVALARLLAACPDPSVRDGRRAMEILQQAMKDQKSFDLEQGQTLAMALASVEQFEKAAQVQRFMVTELERAQQAELANQLRANLELYEHGQPCLTPWGDDDPIFAPIPGRLFDISELTASASAPPANSTADRKP